MRVRHIDMQYVYIIHDVYLIVFELWEMIEVTRRRVYWSSVIYRPRLTDSLDRFANLKGLF